jgi:hypothetical protein
VVVAPADALPHRPHAHLGRHQHVVEPQQGRQGPAVARPGGRPAPPDPLMGVVQAVGQQPRQGAVPAGGVEVSGHHHRVPLLADGPIQPGQLLSPAGQVGPDRRHRVDDVQAQPPAAHQHGRPYHGDAGDLAHPGLGERRRRPQADSERPVARAHHGVPVGRQHPRAPHPARWSGLSSATAATSGAAAPSSVAIEPTSGLPKCRLAENTRSRGAAAAAGVAVRGRPSPASAQERYRTSSPTDSAARTRPRAHQPITAATHSSGVNPATSSRTLASWSSPVRWATAARASGAATSQPATPAAARRP